MKRIVWKVVRKKGSDFYSLGFVGPILRYVPGKATRAGGFGVFCFKTLKTAKKHMGYYQNLGGLFTILRVRPLKRGWSPPFALRHLECNKQMLTEIARKSRDKSLVVDKVHLTGFCAQFGAHRVCTVHRDTICYPAVEVLEEVK